MQPSLKGDDDAVSSYTIKECNTTHQCTLSTYRTRTLHVLEGVIAKGSLYTRMCVHSEKVHPRDQRGCYRRRAPFPFFFPCFLPPPPPPPPSPRPPLLPSPPPPHPLPPPSSTTAAAAAARPRLRLLGRLCIRGDPRTLFLVPALPPVPLLAAYLKGSMKLMWRSRLS